MAKKMKKTVPWVLILAMVVLLGMGFYFQVPKVREAANLATSADFAPNFAYAATAAATGATVADIAPTVSNVSFNAGDPSFAPTENTVTSVDVTGKISEPNGGAECTTITAVAYISGLTSGCSADDNQCYRDISCTTSTSGTLISATCAVPIWFFAHPTDVGSSKEGSTWTASILATDAASNTAEAEDETLPDYTTAYYLDVTDSIAYGSVDPGGDTEGTNQSTGITVTGNAAIDCSLKGTDMTSGTNGTITANKQKYDLAAFTYASGGTAFVAKDTDAALELVAAKPTTTPSDSIDVVYWGLGIDYGTPAATDYEGTNTFTPTGD